ncbi:MAG: RNA polymerase sigma factor [Leptolyngbya sp. PLA3]|nr:MAG: RNA polymerase sigma factor [Cyanobacteria bacterium CYA]MCE7967479.1 RNA polymerase sigma factor [Leptolyngbya sp. PL-A3]
MHDDDLALLQRFVKGDRAALGQLAERHEPALLGLARGLLGGSYALAEEAVQDAWVRVIASSATFEARSEVRTWLYRIVINRCRDLARRARRPEPNGQVPSVPAPEGEEFDMRVREAVRNLPVDQREALMLSMHGLSDRLCAEVLNIPLGTLKSRIRTARTTLRRTLSEVHS